jgi:hypothetical protein
LHRTDFSADAGTHDLSDDFADWSTVAVAYGHTNCIADEVSDCIAD